MGNSRIWELIKKGKRRGKDEKRGRKKREMRKISKEEEEENYQALSRLPQLPGTREEHRAVCWW